VTIEDAEYAPTATIAADEAVRAGVATVMHVDIRFPTTAPSTLAEEYGGFPVGHPGPVTFAAPEGAGIVVEPAKVRLHGNPAVTATSEHVAFDVRVTAAAAGAAAITAELRFALCDKTRCDVRSATLRWSIDVVP
jgi:hypothetical protein